MAGQQRDNLRKVWLSSTMKAGLPGILIHDLRRSAVRNLEAAGVSRSVAMKITGHQTESVYRRYAITSDADLAQAVQQIEGRHVSRHVRAGR
jgi:integrase